MNQTRFKIVPIAEDGFASMRGEWNSLLASSAADNIFLTWEWLFAWWGQFKSGKELCLLAITDGARLAGIAPFYLESRTGVIRFLKLCGAEELYPDYLDLIAAPGEEQAVTEAVAGWLLENSGRWDVLSFDHVLETSAITRLKPYFDGRFEKDQIETSRCPNIKVGGSFDDYLKTQFKRKKRYNLERQVKILMEDKGCVFQKAEPQNGWDGDLDRLFRLHGKRSSEKDIVSSFDSENIKAFHKTFAGLVQGLGILDLRFLLNGGEPVSSSYGFRYKKKLYYYQSGLEIGRAHV